MIVAGLRRNSEIDGIEASMPLGAAVHRLLSFDHLIHRTAYGATRLILVCRPVRIALHVARDCPLGGAANQIRDFGGDDAGDIGDVGTRESGQDDGREDALRLTLSPAPRDS